MKRGRDRGQAKRRHRRREVGSPPEIDYILPSAIALAGRLGRFGINDKLDAIVGSKPLPRSELTKKLWDYIKKNGLQDKKKRTQINADENMRPVFNGKSQVSMFEMTKLVSGHLR